MIYQPTNNEDFQMQREQPSGFQMRDMMMHIKYAWKAGVYDERFTLRLFGVYAECVARASAKYGKRQKPSARELLRKL